MEIGRIQPLSNQQGQTGQSTRYSEPQNQDKIVERKEMAISLEPPTEKDMAQTIDGLNKMFESTHIQFTYHEELGEYYVKIINDKNNEVLKEIPSKKVLDIVAEMGKSLGLIIDKKI